VKLLIANDVDLSRTCLDERAALHEAALWGHNDLVKILLDAKLDLNKKDSKENTPLQLAVEMRHFYIVNIICRFDYKIDNHTLSSRSSTKDVGIWFDSRLVFDVHISSVVAASLKLLGFLFRSCNEFRSAKCLTTLYFSLVGSRLEYGSIIWSPYYATYINSIESVQRNFLKYLSFKEDGIYPPIGVDYDFLCSRFNFSHLKVRRVLDTVTFLFKLFHNKVDCSSLLNGPSDFVKIA
jgi:hypothetical protein